MILSIGMIVKNEEKHLDRCLSALKPLLSGVESELIIADTGSTDRTVEIAKKYTENVFFFEWIKDFSAARNSTLQRARGEWFMFIDADEALVSCDEIITFFKSGEYREYNCATYIQRNFSDLEMREYADFRAPRMTKLSADTRFVNAVHEKLVPFCAPQKHLDKTIANHCGYIFSDEKLREDKFRRNTEILLNRLRTEKNPELSLYLQLYQSFVLKDEKKALAYLDEGIAKAAAAGDITLYPLYDEKAAYYYNRQNYSETIAVCDEYFRAKSRRSAPLLATDADVRAFRAASFLLVGEKRKAAEDFEKFFGIYREIREGRLETPEMAMCCYYLAVEQNYFPLLDRFMGAKADLCEGISATEFLRKDEVGEYFGDSENGTARLVREMGSAKKGETLSRIYSALDDKGRENFKKAGRLVAQRAENWLFDELISLSGDDQRHKERLLLLRKHFKGEKDAAKTAGLLAKTDAGFEELLYIMAAEGLDLSPLLTASEFSAENAAVFCFGRFSDMCEVFEGYPPSGISSGEALSVFAEVVEQLMLCRLAAGKDIEGLLSLWGRAGELAPENPTGALFAAAAAGRIAAARERGDIRACVAELSAMIKVYPKAKPIVMAIRDRLSKRAAPKSEMELLSERIKENILRAAQGGDKAGASALLSEYEKLCPADGDIAGLRKIIFE